MTALSHGPVELLAIDFPTETLSSSVAAQIAKLTSDDTVRLLDLVLITKDAEGTVSAIEIEEIGAEHGFGDIELEEVGLAGDEDIDEIAQGIEPGHSTLVVIVELLWAKAFASAIYEEGGEVVIAERIPAPVVSEVLAAAAD